MIKIRYYDFMSTGAALLIYNVTDSIERCAEAVVCELRSICIEHFMPR